MAKTNFVDGNPALQIEGTIVSAAFLNALNNHRHRGLDEDGDGALDYAADTGSANAYAISLSPALTAHVTGMPITFMAANSNTGASTININGLGAVAIKKNVSTDLAAGNIAAGQLVTVIYDGTNYQLVNTGQAVDLSQFGKSFGTSGYQKLPNGLIIQWVYATLNTHTSTTESSDIVTFPITFPNQVFAITMTTADAFSTDCIYGAAIDTLAQFRCFYYRPSGVQSYGARIIAIGY